ncbi:MAG: hypothetical protein E6K54_06110 [Gammaproteobacteria bacterium]|nr:MAG: hypothetical protein E6K54_06110 [Gammaproteobacteria bacterium]
MDIPNYSNNECKIILVGNLRAGKTALVLRLVGMGFSYNYEPTIRVYLHPNRT